MKQAQLYIKDVQRETTTGILSAYIDDTHIDYDVQEVIEEVFIDGSIMHSKRRMMRLFIKELL